MSSMCVLQQQEQPNIEENDIGIGPNFHWMYKIKHLLLFHNEPQVGSHLLSSSPLLMFWFARDYVPPLPLIRHSCPFSIRSRGWEEGKESVSFFFFSSEFAQGRYCPPPPPPWPADLLPHHNSL
eukprot:Hpha_TRINITY_DN10468_c0_g1::TRINITY_DN10468_c0_g1_i2::g.193448::m.193448